MVYLNFIGWELRGVKKEHSLFANILFVEDIFGDGVVVVVARQWGDR